jgi:predicted metal-dependent hydrolase
MQGGREKAYRPLSPEERDGAFTQGVAAYERGDFFEAHEHLEPAWMGTADPAERNLHQGLIKLAAAFVHAVRGNPLGVAKNLRGARERLADALVDDVDDRGLDLRAILGEIDDRLAELATSPTQLRVDQVPLHRRRNP